MAYQESTHSSILEDTPQAICGSVSLLLGQTSSPLSLLSVMEKANAHALRIENGLFEQDKWLSRLHNSCNAMRVSV
jgi:hypothetical protein